MASQHLGEGFEELSIRLDSPIDVLCLQSALNQFWLCDSHSRRASIDFVKKRMQYFVAFQPTKLSFEFSFLLKAQTPLFVIRILLIHHM